MTVTDLLHAPPLPGPWVADALCAQTDADLWHPTGQGGHVGAFYSAAREICGRCPVIDQCLAYALATPPEDDHGMWGGTTPHERAALRTGRDTGPHGIKTWRKK